MDDQLSNIRTLIQDSLDDILSPRTAYASKTAALQRLECQLSICAQKKSEILDFFVALQHMFECNIPLRLMPWIAEVSAKLETLLNRGTPDDSDSTQISQLLDQLSLSLSLIQGIVMLHPASKTYLGRKYPIEILIDLLLTSRHAPCPSDPNPSGSLFKTRESQAPLSSIVMDALLCILVDSSATLRSFEECSGVQAIVKILKRAGTPREVRMKCLEFLYFYLLDESPSAETDVLKHPPSVPLIATAPATSVATTSLRPKKPYINVTPARPISRYGSSTYSFSSGSGSVASTSQSGFTTSSGSTTLSASSSTFCSGQTSRSTSASSAKSFSSTSSVASALTAASSIQSSPTKTTADPLPKPKTPVNAPSPVFKPKPLQMLQRDLDFVPESPQRSTASSVANTSLLRPHPGKSVSQTSTRSRLGSAFVLNTSPNATGVTEKVRTTEEKKAILGTMLGNVNALVEGVRKAGVWGLG
ncbi:cell division control protein 14, SIN component-domain-containing protein [Desarmillaria tabescens]|uniref:Cell division control protein 14, SIN component-domain-containing protein n=1 Tax=Armillaria tabescens TaxID=1929756 RepID=A0AA39N9V2_ARMTA|nr:cell division control protein 14, SIN component-domain-containing protein [Desarmillaria tabescens]KAK0461663.1 cell division control protein 14, SIN component-domain-containing protein [Desarmillaria tabescens]